MRWLWMVVAFPATTWPPAQILGMPHKDHLAEGADADITIIDLATAKAETTISAGQVVIHHGLVIGRGTIPHDQPGRSCGRVFVTGARGGRFDRECVFDWQSFLP
jgi:predicted amidohydrolase